MSNVKVYSVYVRETASGKLHRVAWFYRKDLATKRAARDRMLNDETKVVAEFEYQVMGSKLHNEGLGYGIKSTRGR